MIAESKLSCVSAFKLLIQSKMVSENNKIGVALLVDLETLSRENEEVKRKLAANIVNFLCNGWVV